MPGFASAHHSCVTALSRRDLKKAQESAAQYRIPYAFDSARELCQSAEVDAIFVATSNNSHFHDVMLAIESRKPVLCEKPLGINASECCEMVQAARRANVVFGVAHVYRFERSTAYLRERVEAGAVGKLIWARAEFSSPARMRPRTWIYNAKIADGGPITDVGVHCIDALRYVLNDEIVQVSALSKSVDTSGDVEVTAALALELNTGTLASILVSSRAEYRTPFEIVGESGTLRADDAFSLERPVEIETRREGRIVDRETVSNSDAFVRQVESFSAAIEGREQFPVSAEEGWQNQEVLDAVYRSLKSGRTENVRLVK